MSKHAMDDEFLTKYIREMEIKMLDDLPEEEELSHKFSEEFEEKMNKLIKQEKRTSFMKSFMVYGKRAVAILLIILFISFITTMNIEASRVKFFQVITQTWGGFTSIVFKSDKATNDEILVPVNPKYIPKGFSILEEVNDYANIIIYSNMEGEEIIYEQRLISDGEILSDAKSIQIETMEIENQTINFFINKTVSQVYWNDETHLYAFTSTIDIEELFKMTKSILKNKKTFKI